MCKCSFKDFCYTSKLKNVFRLEENMSHVMGQNSLTPHRRGSRKNVDRFTAKRTPKAQAPRRVRGMFPREIFSILTTLSALSWLFESVRQNICQHHSRWLKPCKSANYFAKVNVDVVINVQQGKSYQFRL